MRRELPRRFPGVEFFFQPADMVTQILNFGLPAALDVQITGADVRGNYEIAAKLMKKMQQMGLRASDVTQDLLVSTSGTTQTSPGFWLNPANNVVYNLAVQSPQY